MIAVAALPILAALLLLVALRWPARRAMPVCAAVTALAALWPWGVAPRRVAAAGIEAAWITAGILLIVFGALFFLALLRGAGAVGVLQRLFAGLSPDRRAQAVVVGWVLGSFLEGAAGFGTPAAITAPLLMGLGFPPVTAVVVALVGDSTAVSFGAVGTPMLVGMTQGLSGAAAAGVDPALVPSVEGIALRVATYDLLLGALMPALLLLALTGLGAWRAAVQAAPFAIAVGAAQAGAAWLTVRWLGPELPSLVGPLAGLATAAALLRQGLGPRGTWAPADFAPPVTSAATEAAPGVVRALLPYALLLAVLVLTRARGLPLAAWVAAVGFGPDDLLGTGIAARLQPLHSPGAAFVLAALVSAPLLGVGRAGLSAAAREAGAVTGRTALALLAAIATVRVFVHSGVNAADLPAMPRVLADGLVLALGAVWPLAAPWVGALGAFVAGSATFSNLLFALVQARAAAEAGWSLTSVLALQSAGAAAGNMVCVHNVVAACAVAGILGQEGAVLRRTAVPMTVYLLLAGLVGLALG
ncbi:MAG: L-lactate permease [Planctomycetes bacterium]|nr:L-lactate permease [Planctomycetota bacterium]